MICPGCTKRDAPNAETMLLLDIHNMVRGGMRIDREELPAEVWKCLGILTARERVF
jgi:hypothetical protein